jgi:hypothetical protein
LNKIIHFPLAFSGNAIPRHTRQRRCVSHHARLCWRFRQRLECLQPSSLGFGRIKITPASAVSGLLDVGHALR